ncbi:hypothetical protein ACFOVU_19940 [Nocardiopsis sediminis]|uniref:Translation initiation factor 2 n=1 Tax=Nocardiopsis sediminis TaxID=1778267 RepID=A0ABV8FQQ3_9ACTN
MTNDPLSGAPTSGPAASAERVSAFAEKWRTVAAGLRVLAIVHNVTSATRMLDVLEALDSDPRVQTVVTWTRSSIFTHGVEEFLHRTGRLVLDWEDAVGREFDLAITTSLGGELHRVRAPLVRLPHGMGYNKFLKPETGNRKPENGESGSGAEENPARPVFGLSPEWLLHNGELIPSAIVLSHDEQARRLAADCPEAIPAAVVAGDPCFDRLTASLPHRARYRRDLGLTAGQRLLLLSSTWGRASLFGRHPLLARRLLATLPRDEFRIALALHPNVWHGHGPGQVRAWLADARRAGLILIPPEEGWRAAVVAADAVIGDHGSVAYYAAALGRPVVLEQAGLADVAAESPIALLGAAAVPFDPRRPIGALLGEADEAAERTTGVASRWVTSRPGRSLALLRRTMYALMSVPEPEAPPQVAAVPAPVPLPGPRHPALWTTVTEVRGPGGARASSAGSAETAETAPAVRIRRLPAAVLDRPGPGDDAGFLMAWADEADARLARLADAVVRPAADPPGDGDPANGDWYRDVFHHHLGARIAASYDAGRCVLHLRSGERAVVTIEEPVPGFDPALLVAVLYHRLTGPGRATALDARRERLTITAGATADVVFRVEPG